MAENNQPSTDYINIPSRDQMGRVNFLNKYSTPGEILLDAFGIQGHGIAVPSEQVRANRLMFYRTRRMGGDPGNGLFFVGKTSSDTRLFYKGPLILTGDVEDEPPFHREEIDLKTIDRRKRRENESKLYKLNLAAVEGSIIAEGMEDILLPAHMSSIHYLCELTAQNRGKHLYELADSEKEIIIESVFTSYSQTPLISKLGVHPLDAPRKILMQMQTFDQLMAGDREKVIETLRAWPEEVINVGNYIFALLKSGLMDGVVHPDLQRDLISTFIKSEFSPHRHSDESVTADDVFKRFSAYVDLMADMHMWNHTPLASALTNVALLSTLGMDEDTYERRIMISNNNVDPAPPSLKTIQTFLYFNQALGTWFNKANQLGMDVKELVEHFYDSNGVVAYTVAKSNYTATGEALNSKENKSKFLRLLQKYAISLPKDLEDRAQIDKDFDYILALDKLVAHWTNVNFDPELNQFVEDLYKSIYNTPDLLRGTIAPENNYVIDKIVEESRDKADTGVIMVFNHFDGANSHSIVINLKSDDLVETEKLGQLKEHLGLPESASAAEVVSRYYSVYGKLNYLPYAAIHFYTPLIFTTRTPESGDDVIRTHMGEVRVLQKWHMPAAIKSRWYFKTLSKKKGGTMHVVVDETGGGEFISS